MKDPIPGGFFQTEPSHAYYDAQEHWVPSSTQILKLQGLSNYLNIDPEVLENAARRGSEVHALASALNKYSGVDPNWITEETAPFFSAYQRFLAESGFVPDPKWSEQPMIATIHGMKVGVTPDCFGLFGRDKAIIEFKCTATRQASWTIQTAMQEMAIFNSNRCGRVRRFALQLFKDGKYRLGNEHTDHESDTANAVAAIRNVYWRMSAGQDLQKILQV